MTLGERIQSLRKAAGLSQEELGEKLGVARQSVSKWESDSTVPELDKLITMSKLFGVTMGALLGMEESEGADHELTERELRALEAIAQRLTPNEEPAPAEKPRKGRRWPYLLAGLAVAAAGLFLMSRINALENQIGGLHYNVSNIQNTVSREIGSISAQVRDILEEQNSVTAGKEYTVTGMDLEAGMVTFALTATPREYKEGMRAVFSAIGPDFEAVEMEGTLGAGQTFRAELTCPLTDDITLSVGFVTDGTTVNQELGRGSWLLSGTEIGFNGQLGWSMSRTGDKMTFTRLTASLYGIQPGQYKTAEGWQNLEPVEGSLRLWKNDELFWSEEREEIAEGRKIENVEIPTEGLELKEGDRVIFSIRYTDTAGREREAFLDGFEMGDGDEVARPIHLAPYSEEWENNYPWE